MSRLLAGVALVVGLGGRAVAQQVLTVGPGQTYATLGAAIAAAAPGDTVLAIGGSYQENIDIDQRLQLVGQGATMHSAFPGASIHVHDLAPADTVVIRGFDLENTSGAISLPITVDHCEGPVALHDLGTQGGFERWALQIANAPQVHAARGLFGYVQATDAGVVLEQCIVEPSGIFPGVLATSSAIAAVHCSIRGPFTFGNAAVQLDAGSSAVLTRSTLLGTGTGSFARPAIAAQPGSQVLLDPSTTLTTQGGVATVTGATPLVFEFGSLRASSDGAVLTAEAHGAANIVFVTAFSLAAPGLATPFGLTWLDPTTFAPLYAGIYDATTRLHTETIPHAPAMPGLAFSLQAIELGANGLSLGLPTLLTMP